MIRRPPRSTQSRSSAASDVYKRQVLLWNGVPNSRFMTPRFIDQVAADLKQGFASPRRLTDQKANVTGASTTGARRRKRAYSRLKAVLRTAWPRRTGII